MPSSNEDYPRPEELSEEEHTTQLPPTEKPFIPEAPQEAEEEKQEHAAEKTNILRGSADVWTPETVKSDDELFEAALGMNMGELPKAGC